MFKVSSVASLFLTFLSQSCLPLTTGKGSSLLRVPVIWLDPQLLNTVHRPMLQPVLGGHTRCSPRPGGAQGRRSEYTVVPVGNLPLEEVSVPVTDSEAASFLRRSVVLITVRQVARPPLRVETPQGTTLASAWPTISCTPSPGACRQKRQRGRLLQDPRPPSTQKQVNLYTLRHKQCEIVKYEKKKIT